MAETSGRSMLSSWFWWLATGVFGAAVAVGGLALDKRAEDRRQIEVIVEFYDHCYGNDQQRRAASRALQFFAVGGAGDAGGTFLDPLMRGLDAVIGSASADSQLLIDDLLRDQNGCGAVAVASVADEGEIATGTVADGALAPEVSAEERFAPPEELMEEANAKSVVQLADEASAQSVDRRAIRASRAYVQQEDQNVEKIRELFFPRLFIHTTKETDPRLHEALKRLVGRRDLRLNGEVVETPPPQLVDSASVEGVQLRFLKAADKEDAQLLAVTIEHALGVAVNVVDLSDRYEDDPRVRPQTFELWVGGS